MLIKWTPDLATGSSEIDNQHIELFERINSLLESMSRGKGREEVGKVITFLENYVVEHFGMEERYMNKLSYPGYSLHKGQHAQFLNEFSTIKRQFQNEGSSSLLAINIQRKVIDWLKNHISQVDKELGEFLKSRT